MNLKNKEHYENIVSLLKMGLEIYADEDNYIIPNDSPSAIQNDKGSNARFTLNQVNNILKEIDNMDNNFEKLLENTKDDVDPELILKKLTDLANDGVGD